MNHRFSTITRCLHLISPSSTYIARLIIDLFYQSWYHDWWLAIKHRFDSYWTSDSFRSYRSSNCADDCRRYIDPFLLCVCVYIYIYIKLVERNSVFHSAVMAHAHNHYHSHLTCKIRFHIDSGLILIKVFPFLRYRMHSTFDSLEYRCVLTRLNQATTRIALSFEVMRVSIIRWR